MKQKITTLLVAAIAMSVLIGAFAGAVSAQEVSSDAQFDSNLGEDAIDVSNETITVDPETSEVTVDLTYNVSEFDNHQLDNATVTTDFTAVSDVSADNATLSSEQSVDGETVYEFTELDSDVDEYHLTLTLDLVDLENEDEFEDAVSHDLFFTHEEEDEDGNVVTPTEHYQGTSYTLVAEHTGAGFDGATIGNLPVPELFGQFGAIGAFAFYAMIVGSIILAGLIMYLLATGQGFSREERGGAFAVVSMGSVSGIFATVQDNAVVVIGITLAFLVLAVILWKREGRTMTVNQKGTQYWD